mmetsp:Transcript_19005/g.51659  ORF Transcript_19005/g.51659 Transcript_19005/m.51659 type:complete len:223 (+) Transcript_19005:232-900(+)
MLQHCGVLKMHLHGPERRLGPAQLSDLGLLEIARGQVRQSCAALVLHQGRAQVSPHGLHHQLCALQREYHHAVPSRGGQVRQRPATIPLDVRSTAVLPHGPEHCLDAVLGSYRNTAALIHCQIAQGLAASLLHNDVLGLLLHHLQHLLQHWLHGLEIPGVFVRREAAWRNTTGVFTSVRWRCWCWGLCPGSRLLGRRSRCPGLRLFPPWPVRISSDSGSSGR